MQPILYLRYVACPSNRSLADHQAGLLGLYSTDAYTHLPAKRMPQGTSPKEAHAHHAHDITVNISAVVIRQVRGACCRAASRLCGRLSVRALQPWMPVTGTGDKMYNQTSTEQWLLSVYNGIGSVRRYLWSCGISSFKLDCDCSKLSKCRLVGPCAVL